MTATLRSPFNLSAHLRPTVGDQKITFAGTDHMGWVLCNGRGLDTTRFALLFNVIGYTFGGSGNTFKLPDYSGCVPGMAGRPNSNQFDQTINNATYVIGDAAGEQRHRLNIDEMPSHTHGPTDATGNNNGTGITGISGEHFHTGTTDISGSHNHGGTTGSGGYAASAHDVAVSLTTTDTADNTGSHTHTISTDGNHAHTFTTSNAGNHQHVIGNTGGSNYHNNMQPTLFGGNMFIYSGRTMDAYFPYTWVGGIPAPDGTAPNPNVITIY
jgi:microcystin-dependent protein